MQGYSCNNVINANYRSNLMRPWKSRVIYNASINSDINRVMLTKFAVVERLYGRRHDVGYGKHGLLLQAIDIVSKLVLDLCRRPMHRSHPQASQ